MRRETLEAATHLDSAFVRLLQVVSHRLWFSVNSYLAEISRLSDVTGSKPLAILRSTGGKLCPKVSTGKGRKKQQSHPKMRERRRACDTFREKSLWSSMTFRCNSTDSVGFLICSALAFQYWLQLQRGQGGKSRVQVSWILMDFVSVKCGLTTLIFERWLCGMLETSNSWETTFLQNFLSSVPFHSFLKWAAWIV